MTITKCRPTKVQCSHSPGSLLPDTQNKALDVGHCCNPKNNVNSALHVLFDASSELDESLDELDDWLLLEDESASGGAPGLNISSKALSSQLRKARTLRFLRLSLRTLRLLPQKRLRSPVTAAAHAEAAQATAYSSAAWKRAGQPTKQATRGRGVRDQAMDMV